jgi:hypothetical protein
MRYQRAPMLTDMHGQRISLPVTDIHFTLQLPPGRYQATGRSAEVNSGSGAAPRNNADGCFWWSVECRGRLPDQVDPQNDAVAYDRQGWGSITQLEEVPLNPPGTTLRAFTRNEGNHSFFDFGAQPNWGPSASPPAQAPEFSLPVILPVVGSVAAGGVVLIARRRRLRTAHR